MTREVQQVIYLRARIDALKREQPLTAAGRESLLDTIVELEQQIRVITGPLAPVEAR